MTSAENKKKAKRKAIYFLDLFPEMEYKDYLKWARKKGHPTLTKKDFEKEKE